jgi:hypothetical protein
MKIHSKENPNNPYDLMNIVIKIKGDDWYQKLRKEANANIGMKAGYTYYRNMYRVLENLKLYKTKEE